LYRVAGALPQSPTACRNQPATSPVTPWPPPPARPRAPAGSSAGAAAVARARDRRPVGVAAAAMHTEQPRLRSAQRVVRGQVEVVAGEPILAPSAHVAVERRAAERVGGERCGGRARRSCAHSHPARPLWASADRRACRAHAMASAAELGPSA
jgi:hypothetical protein